MTSECCIQSINIIICVVGVLLLRIMYEDPAVAGDVWQTKDADRQHRVCQTTDDDAAGIRGRSLARRESESADAGPLNGVEE